MAKGHSKRHWLDPLARSLLEASGQLPRRPAVAPAAAAPSSSRPNGCLDPTSAADDAAQDSPIETELLALKLSQNPALRLRTAAEVQQAASLGWRLDVNRASAEDWLRLPDCHPSQVDLLLRLQAGGVQLSGPEDLQNLLHLSEAQIRCWQPLLEFRWYGDGASGASRIAPMDLNRATPQQLQSLPGLTPERGQRLVRERQRRPFADLADLQERLLLPAAVVEGLIGRVAFGQGQAGPSLPPQATRRS